MSTFIIEGGHRLSGDIVPQGAKNEALQILSATLLTDEPVHITNVPEILDIKNLINLLKGMGVKVERHAAGDYTFTADRINTDFIESAKPGGDKIGRRKIDTHISGLVSLGASAEYVSERKSYLLECGEEGLKGAYMLLDEASVTGTANIIMAAVLVPGTTTIYNAACEPYIQQLCKMLNRMGANISGVGSNLLTIKGVEKLHGTFHRILPDMIEVGSFIGMAAITQSTIRIKDVGYDDLGIIPDSFRKLGITIIREGDDIIVPGQDTYEIETALDGSILNIADAPWPGLTPDLLSVMLVVATQCRGSVLIHQKMFESRLFFVDHLIDMGAQIMLCDPHRAVVIGLDHRVPLRANRMLSPDIRAGIAMLLAAMSAKGTSEIGNINQIDRGYEDIDKRLNRLGARITRVD